LRVGRRVNDDGGQRGQADTEAMRQRNWQRSFWQRSFCHGSDFIMIAVIL